MADTRIKKLGWLAALTLAVGGMAACGDEVVNAGGCCGGLEAESWSVRPGGFETLTRVTAEETDGGRVCLLPSAIAPADVPPTSTKR